MFDLLVLGSGIAGLSGAVHAAHAGWSVIVLTKGELAHSATRYAQGGVAAALDGRPDDSPELHLSDTIAAGAGLCDPDAVRVLVTEGPERVRELIAMGAVFDQTGDGEAAGLALAREGGHSAARVLHAGGDATGAEIERALVAAVEATAAEVREGWLALDFLVEAGRAVGVTARAPDGTTTEVRARHTIVATGGAGQCFAVTTNPALSTGDGIAMALRAGVAVADVEFMQFHPTALHHPAMPRPLLSEALRGHGALVRDARGERFVDELQPRDVVARAMTARMLEQGVDHLWLDATGLERFEERFPTIAASVRSIGLDPSADWLPIAPAAHYLSGGIVTDLDGASTMPGLWACGEVACSGVHGANRLASNSLLEGMVFAARVVEAIASGREGPEPSGALRTVGAEDGDTIPVRVLDSWASDGGSDGAAVPAGDDGEVDKRRHRLQQAMTTGAGVVRSEDSLATVQAVVDDVAGPGRGPATWELANLVEVARAVLAAATARRESRGAHARSDFPHQDPAFRCRLALIR